MNNNVATVNIIYQAFVKGDVSTIMNYLSDNVEWEPWSDNYGQRVGVPGLKERKGKEGALELFMIVGGFIFNEFHVLSVMGNEDHVAAEISFDVEIPATGVHLKEDEIHLWTFDEHGIVTRFRHFSDTSKQIPAAKSSAHSND
jgi:ketosteroid isomerase-like protein